MEEEGREENEEMRRWRVRRGGKEETVEEEDEGWKEENEGKRKREGRGQEKIEDEVE